MNTVNLIGNIGKQPELQYTATGTAVCKFSLAVKRKFKKDETDWINIVAFSKTAELIANHLDKGSQVGISGHVQTGSYEKDGKRVYTFDVVANDITFIGGKKDNQSNHQRPDYLFAKQGQPIDVKSEDLPF